MGNELNSFGDSLTIEEKKFDDVSAEKRKLQRNEWFGVLLRIRNNAIIVLAIICLQLPFELAYAHLYEITETEVMRSVFPMICLLVGLAQNCATDLLGSFPFLVLYICFSQYFDISGCHSNLHCIILIDVILYRYLLTAIYLVAIQYYTRIGGKVSVNLIKYENNQGEESSSASLVYKVNTTKFERWCVL